MDYLPLSMLNQIAYCERRFYLMHVLGEMEVNAHVLEGTLIHNSTHQPGQEKDAETLVHRQVYVWSERLGLAGFADVVEESPPDGRLYPIEYKKGRMGQWISDHVQLCGQALCLEEHSGQPVPRGAVFYFGSRRREMVEFTAELRERTLAAVQRARELIEQGRLPDPIDHPRKCRDCSLEPVCLPNEVRRLKGLSLPCRTARIHQPGD